MRPSAWLYLLLLSALPSLRAQTQTFNFEQFASGTVLTNQIPGLTFSHATILTAGVSLNSSFPPHSGANVVFDDGGALSFTISFAQPVSSVSGYFTHNTRLTMQAFNVNNAVLATAMSATISNVGSGTANELMTVSGAGISRVVITGNGGGNSFTLDDLTVSQAPTIPALSFPAMAGLAIGIAALGAVRVRRSRTASL